MKRKLLLILCISFTALMQAYAQNRTITGTVMAKDDGLPMPGVTVKVKGTTIGTQTNTAGKYTVSVPAGSATLVFSFIGYNQIESPVGQGGELNITLTPAAKQLGEVVVTGALGIKRQAKELGYAATQIDAKSLTEAKPTNFTNGLTAKAPGLVVSTVDNGINPNTRFTLRGNRHINGNNFALVVLNGVPVSPNEVNSINPDDIESVNILNGSGAAALYGSEASNGALVITTKKGSGAAGTPVVNYSNTFQFEKLSYFPSLQTRFGSYGGEGAPYQDSRTGYITTPTFFENQSYGPAYNGQLTQIGIPLQDGTLQKAPYSTPAKDPRLAFFVTGHSDQNNVSYAQGDQANSFNFSVNNLTRTGTVELDHYRRTTARASATHTTGMLKLDFTASYTYSNSSTYGTGYDGSTILATLLNTPSWIPLQNYKDPTKPFADPNTYFNSYGINPYWTIHNSRNNQLSDIFNGSINATLSPTKWMDATYRLADNFGTDRVQVTRAEVDFNAYALSDPTHFGGTVASAAFPGSPASAYFPGQVANALHFGDGSGAQGAGPQGYSRIQQDVLLNFHKTFFNDFKANLLIGNTIWEEYYDDLQNSSTNLLVNGFYGIGSILGSPTTSQDVEKIRQTAYFGDISIGYKGYAFLEGSLRNDHDSRLAASNRSFFYPSVKGSLLFSQAIPALRNSKVLSYGKLRATYSQVGDVNSAPYGYVNTFVPTGGFPFGNTGGLNLNTTLNNPKLKPELTKEIEFGADLGFFDNRINLSATYYKSNTKDQTLNVTTSPSTGYLSTLINIGEIENTGYEFKLDLHVLDKGKDGFGIDLGGNLAIQNSKVLSLFKGLNSLVIGGFTNAAVDVVVGKPYPELMVTDVNRDPQGRVIVNPVTGAASSNPNLVDAGRLTPKYLVGLSQNFSYKFISLSLVSEFRSGYVVYQQGLGAATAAGVSALSASAGRQVFVFPNSVINTGTAAAPVYTPNTNITIQDGNLGFWDAGSYFNAASTYVVSGAFWKLRSADLAFDLTQWVRHSKFIKRASFSFIGRNLLMIRPKTSNWTDPEFSFSNNNGGLGISTTQLPPTRIYGASLNITF